MCVAKPILSFTFEAGEGRGGTSRWGWIVRALIPHAKQAMGTHPTTFRLTDSKTKPQFF